MDTKDKTALTAEEKTLAQKTARLVGLYATTRCYMEIMEEGLEALVKSLPEHVNLEAARLGEALMNSETVQKGINDLADKDLGEL